jgi:hypothetical protein
MLTDRNVDQTEMTLKENAVELTPINAFPFGSFRSVLLFRPTLLITVTALGQLSGVPDAGTDALPFRFPTMEVQ